MPEAACNAQATVDGRKAHRATGIRMTGNLGNEEGGKELSRKMFRRWLLDFRWVDGQFVGSGVSVPAMSSEKMMLSCFVVRMEETGPANTTRPDSGWCSR
jgi:hypothetical protein